MSKVLGFSFFALMFFMNFHVYAASKYDVKFLSGSSVVSPEKAFADAQNGGQVYKCTAQEVKAGKTGTTLSLKAVKKPKSKEDVERAIEELKKQQE